MKSIYRNFIQILIAGLLITSAALPQENKFTGTWEGKLDVGVELTLVLHLKNTDGNLSATLDSPDQNAYDIKADEVTIKNDSLHLFVKSINAKYAAVISGDGDKLAGIFTQMGNSFPLILKKLNTEKKTNEEIKYNSLWEGMLNVGGVELRLVFKVYEEDGKPQVHLDSPDQGAKNINGYVEVWSDDSVWVTIPSINGTYKGAFIDEQNIEGTWTQGTFSAALNVKMVDEITEAKRPQEPKPPYPYNEENVTFKNEEAGINLAGTLTIPKGEEKYPAVVLVSGSGPQDRDENIFNHKIFKVIADHLTRKGIAVLRYDDRGIGESEGDFGKATSKDFMSDASAGVDYLVSRNDIDKTKIGIIGHSEGGMIAPMAANNNDNVNFILLLAGPGTTGEQILLDQSRLILLSMGVNESYVNKQEKFLEQLYGIIKTEENDSTAKEKIMNLYDEFTATLTEEEKKDFEAEMQGFDQQLAQILSPWFRYFLKYDPAEELKKVDVPVLAINGSKDLQVPPKQNLKGIEDALKEAGNENYKIVEIENLNHLFQTSETGALTEYAKIEETFSPKALEIMTEWILKTTK